MPRPPRIQVANAIYHVTSRGNERAAIVRNNADRRAFVELLASVARHEGWRVLSYCLMNNHYHLLVQIPEPNLAAGMHRLNGLYARRFNRRYARVGHLFQGRYGARLFQTDAHLLVTARYIARNPVSAGICRHASEWRWSSHRATIGLEPSEFVDVDALLAYFGGRRDAACEAYRAFVDDAEGPEPVRPCAELVVPRPSLRSPPPALTTLFSTPDDGAAMVRAAACGYSLREIGHYLGVNASTVSRRLRRLKQADARSHGSPGGG